jgi:peptidoglycan/xylan/chitin deacetylase (PgdA/CDA1 family)
VHFSEPTSILHVEDHFDAFLPPPVKEPPVRFRKRLSTAALKAMRAAGGFTIAADSGRRRNSLLILCYHGISLADEHRWLPSLYITPQQFRERLRLLYRSGASVLPLDEALARLRLGSLPPRSVALTFDDGFVDYRQHAVPTLREFNFPCTLYLTTHYCDYRLPIINLALDYVLWKSRKSTASFPKFGIPERLPLISFDERQVIVWRLLKYAEECKMDTVGKDELARELADDLGVDYEAILNQRLLQLMTPEEVTETAKAGIDVQLHTHRHRVPRDRALFRREIEDNRRRIIDLTGKTPVHFCYPSGEYYPEFFGWLEQSGVQSATTCDMALAHRDSASMQMPRMLDDSGMDLLRFESVVAGLFV